jgi:hypothetical protein
MVSNQLVLAGIVAFATVTPTSAVGGLFDSVNDMANEITKNANNMAQEYQWGELGTSDAELEAAINGIFGDMSGWFDTMFATFNATAVFETVDTAIAEASEGIQGFGETFENVFEDVNKIPEQYAYFLKDNAIDVAELAKEVFSSEAIQGIPDDVAAMFENAGDDIEKSFGMLLECLPWPRR